MNASDERGTIGEETVVGEEDCVVIGDEGFQAGGHLLCSGGGVGGERHESGGHDDFGADGLVEGVPQAAKAVAMGGWEWTMARTSGRMR